MGAKVIVVFPIRGNGKLFHNYFCTNLIIASDVLVGVADDTCSWFRSFLELCLSSSLNRQNFREEYRSFYCPPLENAFPVVIC